jgi:hypothetical protein
LRAVIGIHLVSSRLLGLRESMLQQIGEQFMAGSREYQAALGRKVADEKHGGEDQCGAGGHQPARGGDEGWETGEEVRDIVSMIP